MAIRALLLGEAYESVYRIFNVSQRTLQRWVTRFNERGIDGLVEALRPGRPRRIAREQGPHLRELFAHPEQVGQRHWTARKFHGYLNEKVGLEVGYSTVVRWLHEQDFRLKVPGFCCRTTRTCPRAPPSFSAAARSISYPCWSASKAVSSGA